MNSVESFLFNQAIRATLLLIAAYVATFAMQRASASARRLVWVAAAACLLAMPVLSLLLPPIGAGTSGLTQVGVPPRSIPTL